MDYFWVKRLGKQNKFTGDFDQISSVCHIEGSSFLDIHAFRGVIKSGFLMLFCTGWFGSQSTLEKGTSPGIMAGC